MLSLISLADAKTHLKITGNASDADVGDKSIQATAIIIDYVKKPDHEWTPETVPFVIKAAICLMLTQLYMERGSATITEPIKNLLVRQRDPSIA